MGGAVSRSRHSGHVRAKRRMIALSLGSCTVSAASLAETHCDLTLPPFWPLFVLAPHFQWVDVHFANHSAAVLKAFFICKRPNGAPADCSNNTSLFESFARSRIPGRLALFRPALRNDPASGFARRDKHELRSGPRAQSVGQGAVLNPLRSGNLTRITHQRWTLLNADLSVPLSRNTRQSYSAEPRQERSL